MIFCPPKDFVGPEERAAEFSQQPLLTTTARLRGTQQCSEVGRMLEHRKRTEIQKAMPLVPSAFVNWEAA